MSIRNRERCPDRALFITVLQLISVVIMAAVLITILVKATKVPRSPKHDEGKHRIYQELKQLKAGLNNLCRPCPWNGTLFPGYWELFRGNCYFFSTTEKKRMGAVEACTYMRTRRVNMKSKRTQGFLQGTSKEKGNSWPEQSNRTKEG